MHTTTTVRRFRRLTLVPIAAVAALALAACGGETVNGAASSAAPATSAATSTDSAAPSEAPSSEAPASSAPAKPCGTVNMAINAWVGYEANAGVLNEVLTSLGCKVVQKDIDENTAWQGFQTGTIDAIVENWGKPDLEKKYIDDQKVAVNLGPSGNTGIIGWFVPPWMKEKYPDITDWNNLNKYAELFNTPEVGAGQGQYSSGDPTFVNNDTALVKNLKLNYKVVYLGSEAALIEGFRKAEKNKTPFIGYFYSPQWFLAEVPLVKVDLPKWTEGCDADPKTVACDYPPYELNKIVSSKLVADNPVAADVLKKFTWSNDDQNEVAKMITLDKLSRNEAGKKWVEANPDKVKAWIS